MKNNNLSIVIILYEPNVSQLENTLNSLKDFSLIFVNNSLREDNIKTHIKLLSKKRNVIHIINHNNLGLSKALNQGISQSLLNKKKYILFFDQDTVVSKGKVEKLLSSFINYSDPLMVAMGSGYRTELNNNPYFMKYGLLRKRVYKGKKNIVEVDSVITSGLIVYASIFKYAGNFNENLFIDYVDIEFSLRLKDMGFKIYGNYEVGFRHKIGDSFFSIANKKYPIHAMPRYRLLIKDFFKLFHLQVNRLFIFHEFFQLLLRFFIAMFYYSNNFIKKNGKN